VRGLRIGARVSVVLRTQRLGTRTPLNAVAMTDEQEVALGTNRERMRDSLVHADAHWQGAQGTDRVLADPLAR
jgi:hypothetical protein